jgi:menaquinone-9 beta-reductase
MWDVLIAGAGPAGTVAAIVLARAGARVVIVDRASFPRAKLCGDSVSPGAQAVLRRLHLSNWIEAHGHPIDGMLLTGPRNARVEGRYPRSLRGLVLMRCDFDRWLLEEAISAGAQFEDRVVVNGPLLESRAQAPGVWVSGVRVRSRTRASPAVKARVTIAADGRRSALAFALGLARHPVKPRRWAIGAYFDAVSGCTALGEMHIRAGEYLGIAPLAGGLTNGCYVGSRARLGEMRNPERALRSAIDRDPLLRERFAGARMVAPPSVLGPLAVDVRSAGLPGLLLAGDAAGFVDPVTGDGLRFALRGAELAAEIALQMLATGNADGHIALARRRHDAFAWKWRLNRTLRRIVDSPVALGASVVAASIAPSVVRSLIAVAGDCDTTRAEQC